MTVLFYLEDTEHGGQTAFPVVGVDQYKNDLARVSFVIFNRITCSLSLSLLIYIYIIILNAMVSHLSIVWISAYSRQYTFFSTISHSPSYYAYLIYGT